MRARQGGGMRYDEDMRDSGYKFLGLFYLVFWGIISREYGLFDVFLLKYRMIG